MFVGINLGINQLRGSVSFSPASLFAAGEPGVWFDPSDLTTLFTDPAGTTPVTTPGNTVGLMLDKSKGLALGAELVANGTFDSGIANWTKGAGTTDPLSWDSVGQRIKVTNDIAYYGGGFQTLSSLVVGKSYLVTATISGNTVDARVAIQGHPTGTSLTFPPGGGNARFVFAATSTSHSLIISNNQNTLGGISYWDNISVRELAGNHATQATIAARPTYSIEPVGGRRNLLTYSEDFGNAVWTKNNATVSATQYLAPDGTTTADLIYPTTTGTLRYVTTVGGGATVGATYNTSIRFKAAGIGFAYVYNVQGNSLLYVNLTTGVTSNVGTNISNLTSSIDGNGWVTVSFSSVLTLGTSVSTYCGPCDASGSTQVTASGTNGILIWGCQIEPGSTATNYQRVTTQYDVTEAGVASVSYLYFDGVNDAMATSTITPGTDKAQVFAGVRKLSDAADAIIAEFSTSIVNNGTFYLAVQTAGRFGFASTGSITQSASASGYTAPITAVLTGQANISGDTLTLRANGTQVAQSTADQGTGIFLAYPLYIGARAGTSNPFTGHLYSLITRFGPTLDAPTIASTETWVAGKTGITI